MWVIWRIFNSFLHRLTIVIGLAYALVVGASAALVASLLPPGIYVWAIIALIGAALLGFLPTIYLTRALGRHLGTLSRVAREVAAGNLKTQFPEFRSEDSLGDLYRDLRLMQQSLAALVRNLLLAGDAVEESATGLNAAAGETSRGSDAVAATMNEMSTGTSDLAATIRAATKLIADMAGQISQSSRVAETATGLSQETLSSTESGLALVSTAADDVSELTQHITSLTEVTTDLRARSAEIEEVVQFIASVAEQTDLLALNAAIEAARAGGTTFGVLAERIQTLSSNAALAGAKISKHVSGILGAISRVDEIATNSREPFARALAKVSEAGGIFAQIGARVREITAQIEGVSHSGIALYRQGEQASERMRNIASFSEMMAASVQEVAAVAQAQATNSARVGRTADDLVSLANGFKTIATEFQI